MNREGERPICEEYYRILGKLERGARKTGTRNFGNKLIPPSHVTRGGPRKRERGPLFFASREGDAFAGN